jgi:hypothetical protein
MEATSRLSLSQHAPTFTCSVKGMFSQGIHIACHLSSTRSGITLLLAKSVNIYPYDWDKRYLP